MKPFQQQFRECTAEGFCKGRISKKITANMLPFCPSKAKKMLDAIREGTLTHMEFIMCGRFGGVCRGKHPKCVAMRKKCGTDTKIAED